MVFSGVCAISRFWHGRHAFGIVHGGRRVVDFQHRARMQHVGGGQAVALEQVGAADAVMFGQAPDRIAARHHVGARRSEEHTSELQSLMRISYAVFCLKKKKTNTKKNTYNDRNTENKKMTKIK